MTRFLAEIFSDADYPLQLSLATMLTDRAKHIYVFKTKKEEPGNYWTNWGGGYEGLIEFTKLIQIFADVFMREVFSLSALGLTEDSFYVQDSSVLLHLNRKPWQYSLFGSEILKGTGYSTSGPDTNNPSSIEYDGIEYPALLNIPSVSDKLPSAINGINLKSTFSFSLKNNDGRFDNTEGQGFFNTPCYIRKSTVKNPSYSDFNIIRYGLIEEPTIDFDSIKFSVADPYRTLTQQMTRKINISEFPLAPENSIDKDIPLGWGDGLTVPLIPIGNNQYLAIEPSYLVSVEDCFNSDGVSVSFTVSNGVITSSEDPEFAEITGLNKKAGEIIVEEMGEKGRWAYIDGLWDVAETDIFISNSPTISLFYSSGQLKDFVNKVLENGNWFLITKNDSRLTLRKWGENYESFSFDSWVISKKPNKGFSFSRKYYTSSIEILYNYNDVSGEYESSYFSDLLEPSLNKKWKKKKLTTLNTRLNEETSVEELATDYMERFGRYAEDVNISVGVDTSLINKLDKVQLGININGRVMSSYTEWIVKDINPGQDTLLLEPV